MSNTANIRREFFADLQPRDKRSIGGGFLFRTDSGAGEFDELFAENATIHIERMDERAFWIGINLPNGEQVMVNTGIASRTWFFNVEEDAVGDTAQHFAVQRRSCYRRHQPGSRRGRQ